MKSSGNSGRYELVPARMILRGIPRPADGALPSAVRTDDETFSFPKEMRISGVGSFPTCVEHAKQQAEELLQRCGRRHREGDRSAILQLLDENPEFIAVRWVAEELVRLVEGGRSRRKAGRPRGRYKVHPLVVVGVVDHLIATGRAPNRERAFAMLDDLALLSYDRAKQIFYQALADTRFRAVLLEFPELKREVSVGEAAARLRGGEVLAPGGEIRRRWADPKLGSVELVLKAQ